MCTHRRLLLILGICMLVVSTHARQACAQATSTRTVVFIPASDSLPPDQLAAITACVGEQLNLTGVFKLAITTLSLPTGGSSVTVQGNAQGITGTGLTSGATYRITGGVSVRFEVPETPPFEFSFVNNVNVIGPGEATSARLHVTTHVTVNANGEATANMSLNRIVCQ